MAEASAEVTSRPYQEPDIKIILILTGFLVLLNVVKLVLDRFVYCGLLGQVFTGVLFGAPLGQWLSLQGQEFFVQLGYLGLILLVYEGGLSTSFSSLKANAPLCSLVALTGIAAPIGLSFVLQGLEDATALQSFAAGAALCSTSLGTTFTVLSASRLSNTRLGVVLSGAAMMDDVVGLVMVQVISELGGSAGGRFDPVTVIRPIAVSIGLAIAFPLICRYIVKPVTRRLNAIREKGRESMLHKTLNGRNCALTVHTLVLVAAVTAASYAGTSNLFAAYLSGAAISWWDSELPHVSPATTVDVGSTVLSGNGHEKPVASDESHTHNNPTTGTLKSRDQERKPSQGMSGLWIYETYYRQPVNMILKPLFFASIGFSIPIRQMFSGSVVWRGIVFTILMAIGKLICGLWLIRFTSSPLTWIFHKIRSMSRFVPFLIHFWSKTGEPTQTEKQSKVQAARQAQESTTEPTEASLSSPGTTTLPPRPLSLYPAAILGSAMVARGEIGFLVSSIAASNGIFKTQGQPSESSDIFLIVTWAIVLCTIVGPLGVGLLVRRVRRLEKSPRNNSHATQGEANEGSGRKNVALGVWGVDGTSER